MDTDAVKNFLRSLPWITGAQTLSAKRSGFVAFVARPQVEWNWRVLNDNEYLAFHCHPLW